MQRGSATDRKIFMRCSEDAKESFANGSNPNNMNRPSFQIGMGIALGAGLGAAVAVAIGTGGVWLAIGIAIGVVIGAKMSRGNSNKRNDQQLTVHH